VDFNIAELSGNNLEDNLVIGSIFKSLIVSHLVSQNLANEVFCYRRDTSQGEVTFIPCSEEVQSDDPNFFPFGTDETISKDNSFIISSGSQKAAKAFLQIVTSAVYIGSGIEIWYSTDGLTANKQLSNVIDASNGCRNSPNIYKISWDAPTDIVSYSPVPGDIESRQWFHLKFADNTANILKAPVLTFIKIELALEDISYMDATEIDNGDIDDGNFPFEHVTRFETVGVENIFAFANPATGANVYYYRPPLTRYVSTSYYWSNTGWKTTLYEDNMPETNIYSPPPSGEYNLREIRWDMVIDWISSTKTFIMIDGSTIEVTGYFVKQVITDIIDYGSTLIPLSRTRILELEKSKAQGMIIKSANTFTEVTFTCSIPSPIDCKIRLFGVNHGHSAEFIIPANTRSSWELLGNKILLSRPLTLTSDDQLLMECIYGTIGDIELRIN